MRRPRSSTLVALTLILVAALLGSLAVLMDRSTEPPGRTVVQVRIWSDQLAPAYRESFAAFSRLHPDIDVRINLVSYSNYFTTLRTDVAGGGADDIFWMSNAYLAAYADTGRLLAIEPTPGWEPAVVEQFTRGATLWGVPQLTDAGIAVFFNADLLAAQGLGPSALDDVDWNPTGPDRLRPLLARLTLDADGHHADDPGFDPRRVRQWGYNAANDPQAIYLPYLGSAGAVFQRGDQFAFDSPQSVQAFTYLVSLINDDHVSPSAANTNTNGDFSRNQFLAGRMALFQSGTYNLASVADNVSFHWGVAMLPSGPRGRVSVTNGIAAVGNAATAHPKAVRQVLAWLGSAEGNAYLGRRGEAIPAVVSAQQEYFQYWSSRGIDVTPFFAVLRGPRIPAPGGAGFAAGETALQPYFDEMFLGRADVASTLHRAQIAANAAAGR